MQSVRLNLLSSVVQIDQAGQNLEQEYLGQSKPKVDRKSPNKRHGIIDKSQAKEAEQNKGFGAFCFF